MEKEGHLSWLDRLIYRYAIIPIVRKSLLQQGEQFRLTPVNQDRYNPRFVIFQRKVKV